MRYRDQQSSASSSYGGGCNCGGQDSGISDAAALAAGAVAGFLLYQAITMAAAGRRRKRSAHGSSPSVFEVTKDLVYAGNRYSFVEMVDSWSKRVVIKYPNKAKKASLYPNQKLLFSVGFIFKLEPLNPHPP
jgi:hypothetical protein